MIALLLTWALSLDVIWHRVTLKQMQDTSWTHVCTTGPVVYVRGMADGDIHVTLDDGAHKVIAEIIPQLPLDKPRKGQRIEVCGIYRWDKRHAWAEVHPVISWQAVPAKPTK